MHLHAYCFIIKLKIKNKINKIKILKTEKREKVDSEMKMWKPEKKIQVEGLVEEQQSPNLGG